jgi:predicted nucleic acid-binding Zn ribbon protein
MRESNARLVKWEDGSITMHVGSGVFVVDQRESGSSGYPASMGYLYLQSESNLCQERG